MRGARVIWGGREHAVIELDPVDATGGLASLTPHEREVARLAVEGLSNRAIAARRGTAERTVANQLASIYKKLGVRTRVELVLAVARRPNK